MALDVNRIGRSALVPLRSNIRCLLGANDQLQIDLPIAHRSGTRLNQLDGVQGVSMRVDPFTNATVINFGNDANAGQPVTLMLMGITDPTTAQIQVV